MVDRILPNAVRCSFRNTKPIAESNLGPKLYDDGQELGVMGTGDITTFNPAPSVLAAEIVGKV